MGAWTPRVDRTYELLVRGYLRGEGHVIVRLRDTAGAGAAAAHQDEG